MSNGVNDRLDYLDDTKELLRTAINDTGGNLDEDSTFAEFPNQIQYIIDNTIIPQSELDSLINSAENINGEEVE